MPVLQLVGRGLVGGKGRLGIFVVRPDRLHPLPPAAEGREVLAVLVAGGAGVMRVSVVPVFVRVFAKDLRRIVIHRHGSSLLVIMWARRLAGFMHLFERKPNGARFRHPAHMNGRTQL